jgi:hypothetical protein
LGRVSASRLVDLDPRAAWSALSDLRGQSHWMPLTDVRLIGKPGVGARIEAFTGLWPQRRVFGYLDTMTVTAWVPPSRIEVLHDGALLKGPGVLSVEPADGGGTLVTWTDDVELPGGRLGELAWAVVRPAAQVLFGVALGRFARWATARPAPLAVLRPNGTRAG